MFFHKYNKSQILQNILIELLLKLVRYTTTNSPHKILNFGKDNDIMYAVPQVL